MKTKLIWGKITADTIKCSAKGLPEGYEYTGRYRYRKSTSEWVPIIRKVN